ncbi:MAG: fumarylacetoacetate hydrolase family protein [Pseudomonadota bacterium]
MRLATITEKDEAVCAAVLSDGRMLDIARAANGDSRLRPATLEDLILGGPDLLDALRAVVTAAENGEHEGAMAPPSARLNSPIPRPHKNVFCVGRNYAEHIAEGERAQNTTIGVTDYPVFFTKPPTSIVAPDGDVLVFEAVSQATDYEVELAVVIGTPGRNIKPEDAYRHIFGYTILNDITARDVQRRHGGQYFKGKGLDGSCPIGPWIVTADEIGDPHALKIGLTVNGEQRQDGSTSDMIFDIPTLIASLSEGMTLEPGDIIATGTPSGVGYAMEPPQFLKNGDVVVCEISGIGTLSNTVRAV